ncbi:hypothetical protein V8C86DRAFT_2722151, partial [Haematococcus lacustris]
MASVSGGAVCSEALPGLDTGTINPRPALRRGLPGHSSAGCRPVTGCRAAAGETSGGPADRPQAEGARGEGEQPVPHAASSTPPVPPGALQPALSLPGHHRLVTPPPTLLLPFPAASSMQAMSWAALCCTAGCRHRAWAPCSPAGAPDSRPGQAKPGADLDRLSQPCSSPTLTVSRQPLRRPGRPRQEPLTLGGATAHHSSSP